MAWGILSVTFLTWTEQRAAEHRRPQRFGRFMMEEWQPALHLERSSISRTLQASIAGEYGLGRNSTPA
jgi:hypothetical protein